MVERHSQLREGASAGWYMPAASRYEDGLKPMSAWPTFCGMNIHRIPGALIQPYYIMLYIYIFNMDII